MPQTDVCVVNGNGFFELDPSEANVGLQAAIDSLGANGGTIDIYAGSSTYTFDSAVLLDTGTSDNVVLRNHGASWTFSGGSNLYGIRIRTSNCILDGWRFVDLPGSALGTSTRRIISVEEPSSAGQSNDLIIRNCRFQVRLSDPDVRDYQCISVVGNSTDLTDAHRGLLVDGCTFRIDNNSIPRTAFVSGTTPYGITCIKTSNSILSRIVNNNVRGVYSASDLQNGTGQIEDGNQTLQVDNAGGYTSGASSMVFDSTDSTITGTLRASSTFTVTGSSQIYTVVQSVSDISNHVTVEFHPTLDATISDNAAVTLTQVGFYGHLASFVQLTNSNQSLVCNNTAHGLYGQAAAPNQGTAFYHLLAASGKEGHHTLVGHNQMEELNFLYTLHAEDGEWVRANGNQFGRMAGKVQAAVFMDGGNDCDVIGNNFHNVSGGSHGGTTTSGNCVRYDNVRNGLIDSNSFSLINKNKRPIQLTNCDNVKRGGNNTFAYNKS